jgi:hypothetical protein
VVVGTVIGCVVEVRDDDTGLLDGGGGMALPRPPTPLSPAIVSCRAPQCSAPSLSLRVTLVVWAARGRRATGRSFLFLRQGDCGCSFFVIIRDSRCCFHRAGSLPGCNCRWRDWDLETFGCNGCAHSATSLLGR